MDHPAVAVYYAVNSNSTFDRYLRNGTLFAEELEHWEQTRQGLFVDSPGNTQAFIRLPDNASIFESFDDPSSGPGAGHLEMIFIVSSIPSYSFTLVYFRPGRVCSIRAFASTRNWKLSYCSGWRCHAALW